jgi:hypothetical protein
LAFGFIQTRKENKERRQRTQKKKKIITTESRILRGKKGLAFGFIQRKQGKKTKNTKKKKIIKERKDWHLDLYNKEKVLSFVKKQQ